MKRKPLTDRQQQIYGTICDLYELKQFPPTYRDLAIVYKMTVKAMYDHIQAMIKKGWIQNTGKIVPVDTVISFNDYEGYLDK